MSIVAKALRIAKAEGGPFNFKASPVKQLVQPETHTGPIHSSVAGRTDHLPMHVPSGAYVLPADVVSALGEGNTMAGFKVAKSLFDVPFMGSGAAYGATKRPYGSSAAPYDAPAAPYDATMPGKAGGGAANSVGIIAAGGEHVIAPEAVTKIGKGSMDDGHHILDEFVKQVRAGTIKTLKGLPGPKRD